MRSLLLGLVVLTALVMLAGAVVWALRSTRADPTADGGWAIVEAATGQAISVSLRRAGGGDALTVGSVDLADDDFELALEILRSDARHKLVALNGA